MENTFSPDQLQQIAYGINKGNLPIKFAYLTPSGSKSWEDIEDERVRNGDFSMDSILFHRSLECYLHELGNPEEIQVIDIGGGVGLTAKSILRKFQEKSINIHYHTIDLSPIMIYQCLGTIGKVTDSTEGHLLDIDDGGIGKKIREIKSKYPHIPVLVMVLGNTIGNFQSPHHIVQQIESGIDIHDRIMIGAHMFKQGSEEKVIKEYTTGNRIAVDGLLKSTMISIGVPADKIKTHINWDNSENQVCCYVQTSQNIETKLGAWKIGIQKGQPIRVMESRKFNHERILELRGSQRIACLQTDVRGLYSQILLAPGI